MVNCSKGGLNLTFLYPSLTPSVIAEESFRLFFVPSMIQNYGRIELGSLPGIRLKVQYEIHPNRTSGLWGLHNLEGLNGSQSCLLCLYLWTLKQLRHFGIVISFNMLTSMATIMRIYGYQSFTIL